jgi:hypothetical protein
MGYNNHVEDSQGHNLSTAYANSRNSENARWVLR